MPCLETNLTRHATLLSPRLVLRPLLVQIQSHVHQSVFLARNVPKINAHLAVVDLSKTTKPLPCHTNRFLALFLEARGIENEHTIGLAQLPSDLLCQLLDQQTIVPKRLPNELLQRLSILVVKIGNGLRALPFHVREQPGDVLPKMPLLRGALHDRRKGFGKPFQTIQHPLRYSGIEYRILQKFLQSDFKPPFHRLLLSLKHTPRKGLISKELQPVNVRLQSKYNTAKL